MSWDVLVLNLRDLSLKNFDSIPKDYKPNPLGVANEVRNSISQYLPNVNWSDETWGILIDDEFLIEFNLGEKNPIESITLHVRGQGDAAIKTALKFTIPNQWSLYDLTVGELLDLNNPSDAGWKKFRAFRDQIF